MGRPRGWMAPGGDRGARWPRAGRPRLGRVRRGRRGGARAVGDRRGAGATGPPDVGRPPGRAVSRPRPGCVPGRLLAPVGRRRPRAARGGGRGLGRPVLRRTAPADVPGRRPGPGDAPSDPGARSALVAPAGPADDLALRPGHRRRAEPARRSHRPSPSPSPRRPPPSTTRRSSTPSCPMPWRRRSGIASRSRCSAWASTSWPRSTSGTAPRSSRSPSAAWPTRSCRPSAPVTSSRGSRTTG